MPTDVKGPTDAGPFYLPASKGCTSEAYRDTLLHYYGQLIDDLLVDTGFTARVSKLRLCEVITHWQKDVHRLAEVHNGNVNPAKFISYLSFWIRKIKPISDAYHIQDITPDEEGNDTAPYTKEFTDINERIAILLAMSQLLTHATFGTLDNVNPEDPACNDIITQRVIGLKSFFNQSMHFPADVGSMMGSNYHSFIYDMRYRTYGPHHLTTWLNQALCASRPSSAKKCE